ncbi:amidohydrolase family protein [Aquimarina brevivitae]|uniref:Imidazolonepropionase-like amidohydrolase n=1 Tax=Aquimarina brevivitae TaxID=323412 RepID=A0A4Q7PKL8_9FLAO|nr:amidohydrolase family protein [Aquimarina brevivitae]RZS99502.1 imidazolonepropionase-like amidohydrolase [Aquimarina brevivitae]
MITCIKTFQTLTLLLLTFFGSYAQTVAIDNVNIITMHTEKVLERQRIIIEDGIIVAIEPSTNPTKIKVDQVINGDNNYLIPGLAETHYHLQNGIERESKLMLANGITTVVNMAEEPQYDQIDIREKANSGRFLAPHYYTTGPYLMASNLDTKSKIDSIITNHKNRGYDFLKLADNLPQQLYSYLLQQVDIQGIPVIGHGQRKLPLRYSLRMKNIAHIEEFMNIFTKAQRNDDNYLQKVALQIRQSGVYVSPTLGVFEMIMNYADDQKLESYKQREELKYLPVAYFNFWTSDTIKFRKSKWFTAPESLQRLEAELAWQQHFTHILNKAGVHLLAGSDTYGLFLPGFTIHHELQLMVDAGLTPYEALLTATVNPARYLGKYAVSGTIEVGKKADLVMLRNNPLEAIENTKTIAGLFFKGKWFDRPRLDALLDEVEKSR